MTKIIAFILSALMFFFNTFSNVFPGILPDKPVENTFEFCDAAIFASTEEARIIDDFASWYETADRESETYKDFGWKYFFTGSLALVPIELPCEECEAEVEVIENDEILSVSVNTVVCDSEHNGYPVKKIVVVKVNKGVSSVEVDESVQTPEPPLLPEEPEIPEEPQEYVYTICPDDGFSPDLGNYSGIISDIESFKMMVYEDNPIYSKYCNEEFFENHNLAILYITIERENYRILDIERNGSSLRVDFNIDKAMIYNNPNRIAVAVEADKDIDGIYWNRVGVCKEYYSYWYEGREALPVNEDTMYTLTSMEEYEDFKFNHNLNLKVTDRYFEFYDVYVMLVRLPSKDHELRINTIYPKSENEIGFYYSIYKNRYYSEDDKFAYFEVVVMDAPKGVTITPNKLSFDNKGYFYNSTLLNVEGCGNYMLVSDYDSWCQILKTDPSDFPKYDAHFFKNYSLVLKPERVLSSDFDYRFLTLLQIGNTLEVEYAVDYTPQTEINFEEDWVLLVEVTKNVDSATFKRNDNTNECIPLEWGLFGNGFCHDYETFASKVDVTDERFEKYDEEYFETKSLVFVGLTTWNIGDEILPIYAYEDGNTLHLGYSFAFLGMLPSFSVACVIVEVSKDVTNVEPCLYN